MQEILSVGIDIGTTTTQLIFSKILIENTAGFFTVPRVSIVDKKILYKSPVYFTPLTDRKRLDEDGIRRIIKDEFRKAGFTPRDTDTGAVIITGESAGKENAAATLQLMSDFSGDFVVAAAGPDLESIIAGKGSGAYRASLDEECIALNLDIGGGTTNIVRFDHGQTDGACCLDIGGRLIQVDENGVISYISPAARLIAGAVGVDIQTGQRADAQKLTAVTDKMARLLSQAAGLAPREELLLRVLTPGSSGMIDAKPVDRIYFSGGVADCMDKEKELFRYGDIGILLGRSISRNREFAACGKVRGGAETIRATVVGAGTYTTSLSGSTIFCDDGVLPLKNLPVFKLTFSQQEDWVERGGIFLGEKLKWFLRQANTQQLLLALPGYEDPSYVQVRRLAGIIGEALHTALPEGAAAVVAVEKDMAKALGYSLSSLLRGKRSVVCIDSVHVDSEDFADIGTPLFGGMVVPVVIKTLLFQSGAENGDKYIGVER